MLLSREEFVKIIERLQAANDIQNKVDEIFRESKDNIENDFMNAASLQISHESIVIALLKKIMGDDEYYSDIEYFIYELDYGRKYIDGMISDNDGNHIDFSTSEKLYDYLIKINGLKGGMS